MAITAYKLVGAENLQALQELVDAEIAGGYEPFGTPIEFKRGTGPAKIYQAFVTGTPYQSSTPSLESITGADSSLGITGQTSGTGGAVAIVGGTSTTAATVGGSVTITGGVGTSGNSQGGAVTSTGGAGLGASAGGVSEIVGGAGGTTGAGGAAKVTGGAGGATSGLGGAVTLITGASSTDSGSASGSVSISSNFGAESNGATAGGASGQVAVFTGAGGANNGAASGNVGGASGNLSLYTGNGGSTDSTGAHAGGAAGDVAITGGNGGAAADGTGNGGAGGTIRLTAGTGGTSVGGTAGADGVIILRSTTLVKQGAPAAKTTNATLTAAEVLTGIITVNQGAAGTSAQQLPLAADMDTALPDAAAGDAFDFSLINISTVAAEDATITTNTGWTLVGEMTVESNDADRAQSSGRFRARKTGAGAWTLYRLS